MKQNTLKEILIHNPKLISEIYGYNLYLKSFKKFFSISLVFFFFFVITSFINGTNIFEIFSLYLKPLSTSNSFLNFSFILIDIILILTILTFSIGKIKQKKKTTLIFNELCEVTIFSPLHLHVTNFDFQGAFSLLSIIFYYDNSKLNKKDLDKFFKVKEEHLRIDFHNRYFICPDNNPLQKLQLRYEKQLSKKNTIHSFYIDDKQKIWFFTVGDLKKIKTYSTNNSK